MTDTPAILGGPPVRPTGPPTWPRYDKQIIEAIHEMAESGDWGRYHGPNGPILCRSLSAFHEVEHIHLCSSGTVAVELALRGLGIGAGDEVILAGYDFKSNFQNVLCVGAVPVLVDLRPANWQLDSDRLASAISPRTRAIIVSHLHGGVVDVQRVRQVIDTLEIAIIEDACQNPGAMLFGQRAGTWGDVGVLSFGGSKLLTAGRGGAVLTQRADIAERIKRYVLRGNDAYPFSEMQAAILLPQLEVLDELNDRRRHSVQLLCNKLNGFRGLEVLQPPTSIIDPAYYKLGFRFRSEEFCGLSRELFTESMRAEGIAMDTGFRGLHLIHASRRFRAADSLAEATAADARIVTLHHPVLLEDDSAIEEIVTAVHKIHEWADEIATKVNPA